MATGSQNIRWNVDRHKKEPQAVHAPGVRKVVASACGSSVRAAGCRGMGAARMGAFHKVLFTNNSTVNLTSING
jgi:hypothetical protein